MSDEIMRAILSGDVKTFESLVQQGADVKAVTEPDQWNLLHRALVSVSVPPAAQMIQKLIDGGVEVNAKDAYGNTPLHYAARLKRPDLIEMLLDNGAEIDPVNNDGVTPLRMTLLSKPTNLKATERLLSRGAAMHHKVEGGATVREYARTISHGDDRSIIELFDRYSDRG